MPRHVRENEHALASPIKQIDQARDLSPEKLHQPAHHYLIAGPLPKLLICIALRKQRSLDLVEPSVDSRNAACLQ
jgi:hypothetical protein